MRFLQGKFQLMLGEATSVYYPGVSAVAFLMLPYQGPRNTCWVGCCTLKMDSVPGKHARGGLLHPWAIPWKFRLMLSV